MALLIVLYIGQMLLVIHVVKTGRPFIWAWLLIMAPGIGALAYLIAEIIPEMRNSHAAGKAMKGIKRTLDPGGELRRRQFEHRLSGSVDAARYLAAELMENKRYGEAITHYQTALTGIYEHDPDLLLGLATAQYGDQDAAGCRETLDRLKEHNPEYSSADGHLLYAKTLEALEEFEQAEEEYAALADYYPGAEARVRLRSLLGPRAPSGDLRRYVPWRCRTRHRGGTPRQECAASCRHR